MWWDFCSKREHKEETYEDFRCSCYIEQRVVSDQYQRMQSQAQQEMVTNLGIMNMNIHR